MKKSQIKQKDLDMIQEIIDHVYEPQTISLPRSLRKMLKKEARKSLKKSNKNIGGRKPSQYAVNNY